MVLVDSLGNRETLVLRVLQGLKVSRVRKVIRAQPVRPDHQELPDYQDRKDKTGGLVTLDTSVTKAIAATWGPWVLKDRREWMERLGRLGRLEERVPSVILVLQEKLADKGQAVKRVVLVMLDPEDIRDPRATREFLDREENMVTRENRGEPGCLEDVAGRDKEESGERLVTLARKASWE